MKRLFVKVITIFVCRPKIRKTSKVSLKNITLYKRWFQITKRCQFFFVVIQLSSDIFNCAACVCLVTSKIKCIICVAWTNFFSDAISKWINIFLYCVNASVIAIVNQKKKRMATSAHFKNQGVLFPENKQFTSTIQSIL